MVDIAVVGAGTMGAGIAESAALAGLSAVMLDIREDALDRGRGTIERDLERRVKRGRLSEDERREVLGRVSTTTSLEACADAPLVVEAVVEDLEVKKKVFVDLEDVVGDEAVLATNTSSLSVAGIAAATERPERVVGMHFFNPVPAMRLVEVITGPSTEPSVVRRTPGQDADPGLRHTGLRRESRRPAFLPGGLAARRGRWRARTGGRGDTRGRVPDGAFAACGSHRHGREPRRLRVPLRALVLPVSVSSLCAAARHGGGGSARPEDGTGILRVRFFA